MDENPRRDEETVERLIEAFGRLDGPIQQLLDLLIIAQRDIRLFRRIVGIFVALLFGMSGVIVYLAVRVNSTSDRVTAVSGEVGKQKQIGRAVADVLLQNFNGEDPAVARVQKLASGTSTNGDGL
jgi:hypothetical protein